MLYNGRRKTASGESDGRNEWANKKKQGTVYERKLRLADYINGVRGEIISQRCRKIYEGNQ